MKIVIVGAGIGGLSTYLALKKHISSISHSVSDSEKLSISLVESHPSPMSQASFMGGGLGLAPNGLLAIASLSQSAIKRIQSCSFPNSCMVFRNAQGNTLGTLRFGSRERYGYEMCMLPRDVLHEALLAEIDDENIKWDTKVVGIKELEQGGIVLEYADGTIETADLVIGADGVRSVVKDYLFNGQYQCRYDGLTGVGGFLPTSSLPQVLQKGLQTEGVVMTFGKNGFFGYSNASPLDSPEPFIQWWSIYESEAIPDHKDVDYDEIKAQLLKRHGDWMSPYDDLSPIQEKSAQAKRVFQSIIELAFQTPRYPGSSKDPSAFSSEKTLSTTPIVLPRFTTPQLPHWSNTTTQNPNNRGRIVLLGDAAHTIQPDVGQGASCAVEDAVVYSLLLKHYISTTPSSSAPPPYSLSPTTEKSSSIQHTSNLVQALIATANSYESIRKPRVQCLMDQGQNNMNMKKELNVFLAWLRDLALKILCKLPESIQDGLFAYNAEEVVAKYLAEHPDGKTRYRAPCSWLKYCN